MRRMFLPRNQSALVAFWLCDRDLRLLLAVPPTCSLIHTLYRKRQTAQNVIERAVILSDGDTFSVDETWLKHEPLQLASPRAALNGALLRQEKEMIEAALAESHGGISGPTGAAANLGLPTRTLDSKIKRLGINKYRFKVPQAS